MIVPLVASLLQLAVSRSREYLADETGAECCQDPLALASALKKLHNSSTEYSMDNQRSHTAHTGSLFIVNPFSGAQVLKLFATHPPVEERIARLEQMYEKRF